MLALDLTQFDYNSLSDEHLVELFELVIRRAAVQR